MLKLNIQLPSGVFFREMYSARGIPARVTESKYGATCKTSLFIAPWGGNH